MSKVTDIRRVAYAVKNLEAERRFYREVWQLTELPSHEGMAYFAAPGSPEHHVVRLREHTDNRLDVVSFKARSAADVDALFEHVTGAGVRIVHEPAAMSGPGGGYGFRFFSPDGLPLEISSDVATRAVETLQSRDALPERISHVVLHSPDHKALATFFIEVLGLRLSDWIGDFMVFLRTNSWHHRVALLPGPPCLNHVAYDVPDVDGMMRAIGRLKEAGRELLWGPGRHTAGDNTFSYFASPNGFIVEYTAELEEVDEARWQPTVYPPSKQIMDQWGMGVGGPQTMPKPVPDPGLFKPAGV